MNETGNTNTLAECKPRAVVCPATAEELLEAAGELAAEKEEKTADGNDEKLICFVCTGNTCRSPMAEALFNSLAAQDKLSLPDDGAWRAVSAGIAPVIGEKISEGADFALTEALPSVDGKYPWREHRARKVDRALMEKCSLIVAITDSHMFYLLTGFPEFTGKLTVMPRGISDPYGGSHEDYKKCLVAIREGIEELFHAG